MGRVSLTEDYDDRSVIAKLNEMDKRVKENAVVVTSAEASAKQSAQAAQETADRFAGSVGAVVQNANAQINASKAQVDQAKAEVDATVTTVAQAVQTANQASASAQQSATTVETYDTRLTATESKNDQQDTAIGALQTADAQNVKLSTSQTITGNKTFTKTMFMRRNFNFDATAGDQWGGEIQMNSGNTRVGVVENFVSKGNLDLQLFSQNPVSNKYGSMGIHLSRDGKTNYCFGFNPTANAPSNAFATKAYVESTDGVTNNLVHRTADESINGYKQFEYSPSIKRIYVNNNNLTTKWVRLCYYKENNNYEDMHMVTRFISGHTVDSDFMFTVDIKQRSAHQGATLTLVDNASYIPLCINKAPVMGQKNCGLIALWVPHDGVPYIEIWGKLPSNRLCIIVQNYVSISDMPTAEGVYMDSSTVGFDKVSSFVTWDCATYSDTLPSEATKTQYIQKGNEDVTQ